MPIPPPDSEPHDPAARLSELERGLASLTSRCDDLATLLNQLLDSARTASQRRSNLILEVEALSRRVGALEEGQAGATANLREIINRLATTVPVQTQLSLLSEDLKALSGTWNQAFEVLGCRWSALEKAQAQAAKDLAQIQEKLQASDATPDQIDEISQELRRLSECLSTEPTLSEREPQQNVRLANLEQEVSKMASGFHQMEEVCRELRKLL
jgi:chromosome segregation ATPase